MNNINISRKIMEEAEVFARLKNRDITQPEAAQILGVTVRTIGTKIGRYRAYGCEGLQHRNKGKPSPSRIPIEHEKLAMELLRNRLQEAGPTYLAEKLFEINGIKVSNESMRQIMIRNGEWKVSQVRPKHRSRRPRRTQVGIMVQLDGSPHDWFEGRAPRCTLLVFIDDATSRILWLEFVAGESVKEVMAATINYMQKFGRPISFYVDYGSVWSVNTNNPDRDRLTQFERAMKELDVNIIHARSPQAKGRVERANQTLQDRLIKDMRLANICSWEAGNKFAQDTYIPAHNARFAVDPAELIDAHRSLDGFNLNHIMSIREERIISQDYVISYHKQLFQLTPDQSTIIRPKERVTVNRYLDDQITIFAKNTKLNFKEISSRPEKVPMIQSLCPETYYKPYKNYPLRMSIPIPYHIKNTPAPTPARTFAEAAGLSPVGE